MPKIGSYIKSSWNILDFIVVVGSLVDLYFSIASVNSVNLKSLRALRALRALRPLRMVSRNEGLRVVVNSLFASIPAMTNLLMVVCLFLIIFSILGVNFYKGRFFNCEIPEGSILEILTK